MLKVAVLLYTKEDYWAGYDVAVKNGNCAVFVRSADLSVPADAKNSQKLYIVGGGSVGHPNEILLSGKDKYQTAAAVAKYLGGN
jgi:N-acetylmuramoyl-L-alanine amidase